jgi:virulence-associated protein VapD
VPYEETFVGRFAVAFLQFEVLNAAVSSYAPSVYYAKTKYLLDSGFHLDEVTVYIDISDVQDEATTYRAKKRIFS